MLAHVGWGVACPLCGWRGRAFYPHDDPHPRANAMCPRCYAKERHRALFGYLARRPGWLTGNVLEIGPGPYSYRFFRRQPAVRFVGLDYADPTARVRGDITRLPLPSGSVDLVLCLHVLEHIPDDRVAMVELHRVLRHAGRLLVQVPIVPADRLTTHEDPQVTEPAERTRLFGQPDHVRAYGWDVVDRLTAAGFAVHREDMTSGLSPRDLDRAGITAGETVLVCRVAGRSRLESVPVPMRDA